MRSGKVIALAAALAVSLTVMATQARAEEKKGPCQEDAAKLCPDLKPGAGNFQRCLKEHAAELSPACKKRLSHLKAGMSQWQEACGSDLKSLCAGIKPGGGRIIHCLQQHNDKLAPDCKAELEKIKSREHHAPPAAAVQ